MKPNFLSRFLPKKPDPASLDDIALRVALMRCNAKLSPLSLRGDAMIVIFITLASLPVTMAGLMCCGLTGLLPLAGAAAVAYGIREAGVKIIRAGRSKNFRDKADLEAETEIRQVRRQTARRELALKQAEEQAAAIRENARRLKEAFEQALQDGLPLEQAVQIRRRPITFKPRGT